ncbi:hypothetical protein HYT55_04505 [Candidatus Woesearchaeota archaeon]|nr:hypothetical protein [Candidatus Woesearchaeota archaeon]
MVVFENVSPQTIEPLLKKGFSKVACKTIYEKMCLEKNGVKLTLYTSGKLLLQGKQETIRDILPDLKRLGLSHPDPEDHFRKETGWIIGSDESLKGDTFGGIVVAAVKADNSLRQRLEELGVADSKLLEDREIVRLADEIKKIAPCEIKSLLPQEYNHVGKVTLLLNNLHHDVAKHLQPGKHVVDKYPGCTVGDLAIEKAESKYVEVAAASILARAAALQQLQYLSSLAGFTLPKGSTHVQLALHELKERKLDFRLFVKMEFRNVREFLD